MSRPHSSTREIAAAAAATSSSPGGPHSGDGRRGPRGRQPAALATAMLGFFVVALDAQIVNVALPEIGRDLGGGLSGLQWVVTGYTLTFSSLLLFAGTFSDRVGARRAYGLGMIVFVAASAACGVAPSLGALVAARVAQGVGAALITPTSLALIREAYDDGPARTRAVAYWALGGSVAAAAGPIAGGVLAGVDWRIIFFINLPVGALALSLLAHVDESPRRTRSFDVVGQCTAIVALAGLTYAIIEGGSRSYGDPDVLAALALAALGALSFVISQARGRSPMVPLDLFRSPTVAVSLAIAFVTMAGFYGVVFVQSLYFQQVRGASPVQTGLLFLPMTALIAALNPVAARIAIRLGPRVPIVVGQLMMAVGLCGLTLSSTDQPVWTIALLMIPVGVGGSLTVPPLTSLLLDAVPQAQTGTASGVLNTARQVGGSMGVAVSGAVIAHVNGFVGGSRVSLAALAALVLVTCLLGPLLPSRKVAP